MAPSELVNPASPIDDAKCFEPIRQYRWPDGVRRPGCGGAAACDGHDETRRHRRRHRCGGRGARFDDLGGTVPAGHRQPLRVWVPCPYFMGLNPSNRQIAGEPGPNGDDVRVMACQLRRGPIAGAGGETLGGAVGIDEVHVAAGPKGNPAAVQKKAASDGGEDRRARVGAAPWGRRGRQSSA